jgi:hypothetical protein
MAALLVASRVVLSSTELVRYAREGSMSSLSAPLAPCDHCFLVLLSHFICNLHKYIQQALCCKSEGRGFETR